MKLAFDLKLAENYKSPSQIARVLSERWVHDSIFCPNCGRSRIGKYPNGKPVADFYCAGCQEDYELKSKKSNIGIRIVDGAYKTMIKRLESAKNPNFFLLSYDPLRLAVKNFLVIPKHFFVPRIIEKRAPLSLTARRARYVGCNIFLKNIPPSGKIFYVRNGEAADKDKVLADWQKTLFLREAGDVAVKGWLIDVMRCVDKLGAKEFSLNDVYSFENELSRLHPDNKHVKDKIRQQLQFLRDRNYLEFSERGKYRLI